MMKFRGEYKVPPPKGDRDAPLQRNYRFMLDNYWCSMHPSRNGSIKPTKQNTLWHTCQNQW